MESSPPRTNGKWETRIDSRSAGVCLHLTSLPGPYGIGEIGDAAFAFVDTMVDMGLGVWQFLPTGPTAYGDSPYQPLSTFAGNELLIDTASLIRSGLLTSNEADSLLQLPENTVDYGALIPQKRALLEHAARRFRTHASSDMKAALDRFQNDNGANWLDDYALFRTLKTRAGERPWAEWQQQFAHRDAKSLAAVAADAAVEIESVKILQFLFHYQWQKLKSYAAEHGVLLFGDMPICIADDSSDVWANRDIVRVDDQGRPTHVAGVPPDYFSEDGQLWGNPLYDWERHADDGYRWWIERLRHATRAADVIRIDHFRAFEAYWSIPSGSETARNGEWLPGPGDDFFEAVREALGSLPIVAEDLGFITPEVRALRERHGIPGMVVLQFEVEDDNFEPGGIPRSTVCYTGTHDNDTTLGWFHGSADDLRDEEQLEETRKRALDLTNGSPASIHIDMIRLAFATDSMLAIAPMQDFLGLGSEARLNVPGTSANNWRWRVRADQLTPAVVASVGEMVDAAGRRLLYTQ